MSGKTPQDGAREKGAQAARDGLPRSKPYRDVRGGVGMNKAWLAGHDEAKATPEKP